MEATPIFNQLVELRKQVLSAGEQPSKATNEAPATMSKPGAFKRLTRWIKGD